MFNMNYMSRYKYGQYHTIETCLFIPNSHFQAFTCIASYIILAYGSVRENRSNNVFTSMATSE